MVHFSKILGLIFSVLGGLFFISSFYMPVIMLDWSVWSGLSINIQMAVLLDQVSLLFSAAVLLISGSVMNYCDWYMNDEVFFKRFVYLVGVFVLSMLLLVFIPNMICLLIGWDGLGISSFLLVVFYQNSKSLTAGMLTALVNRIGDVLLLVSIMVFSCEGSWLVYLNKSIYETPSLPLIMILASITKSAQMPFSAWLPAAMAAPTPVSSLVHSSTLVTAGVYLLLRSKYVFLGGDESLFVLKILSCMTLLMAGSCAMMETDLKKVVALSTLSQLSVMLFSLSVGAFSIAFFHLVSHAFFKALLFLCAGVAIHSNKKTQDIRLLGLNWESLPVTMSCFMIAVMALCGTPFFSGFYSKDMVFEVSLLGGESICVYFFLFVGFFLTSAYSIRLVSSLFFGLSKSCVSVIRLEETAVVKWSYLSLVVSSCVVGWLISSLCEELWVSLYLNLFDKMAPSVLAVVGVVFYSLTTKIELNKWHLKISWFLSSMWGLKSLSTQLPAKFSMGLSCYVEKVLEKGWLENSGPQGVLVMMSKFSRMSEMYHGYSFLKSLLLSVLIVFFSAVVLLM
uniref:NADH-ubiquinone oxidoreductase chain 5 n=1 Tax=Modiolus philippinarum TaxID=310899 RepID=A0A1Z2WWW2_9BIVA|nr:NADH dehydrogenase subunit 5 [Modiolus philippinarum]ASB29978.1 NADH dehydrogenase subunit 5 [Modiolus philippinarum]